MKKSVLFVSAALMLCYFTSCGGGKKTDEAAADATAEAKTEAAVPEYKLLDLPTVDLSKFPKDADGWITMFDGKTLNGWRGYGRADAPARWSVNDGAIYMKGSGAGEAGAGHPVSGYERPSGLRSPGAGQGGVPEKGDPYDRHPSGHRAGHRPPVRQRGYGTGHRGDEARGRQQQRCHPRPDGAGHGGPAGVRPHHPLC